MKRLFVLALIFSACSVEYQGLIVDKYYVEGEVNADSGYARIEISRKYSHSPVTAHVTVNNRILDPHGPGIYMGNVTGTSYRLIIETYDERMDLSVEPPGSSSVSTQFFGDTLKISWLSAENASYYRLILSGGALLDATLVDTTFSVPVSGDTVNYSLQIISGPGFENGQLSPNLENGMWEVYFKVTRSLSGTLVKP